MTGAVSPPNIWHCSCSPTFREGTANVQDRSDSEVTVPCERLRGAGHQVRVVGTEAEKTVKGKRGRATATVEIAARDSDPAAFDALVIPGGHSPDHLRLDRDVVAFVGAFCASGKLVAAVCHGPQLLIEADAVSGRTLTSWPSVRKDLRNAGARWIDREVVERTSKSHQRAAVSAYSVPTGSGGVFSGA